MPPEPSKKHWLAWIVLTLTIAGAGAVLGFVLQSRYESGEGYPEYSCMRADPLGTKALFEALNQIPETAASRNFSETKLLEGRPRTTLLLCGVTSEEFNSGDGLDTRALTLFAAGGGRVVVALKPSAPKKMPQRVLHNAETGAKKELKPQSDRPQKSAPPIPGGESLKRPQRSQDAPLAEVLGVKVKARENFPATEGGLALAPAPGFPLTSAQLPHWFSNDSIEKPEAKSYLEMARLPAPGVWKTIAHVKGRNTVLERKMGAGSIVVCSDRYFLSNEALWKEPAPEFLSWLLGDARTVIFEETHFGYGIGDSEGVMTLARRYKMDGLFIGGLLLFGLVVWRQTNSLVPPDPQEDLGLWHTDAIQGQSGASGIHNLLRRGIKPGALLKHCWETWEKSPPASAAIPRERIALAREKIVRSPLQADPTAVYREITSILNPAASEHLPSP